MRCKICSKQKESEDNDFCDRCNRIFEKTGVDFDELSEMFGGFDKRDLMILTQGMKMGVMSAASVVMEIQEKFGVGKYSGDILSEMPDGFKDFIDDVPNSISVWIERIMKDDYILWIKDLPVAERNENSSSNWSDFFEMFTDFEVNIAYPQQNFRVKSMHGEPEDSWDRLK